VLAAFADEVDAGLSRKMRAINNLKRCFLSFERQSPQEEAL